MRQDVLYLTPYCRFEMIQWIVFIGEITINFLIIQLYYSWYNGVTFYTWTYAFLSLYMWWGWEDSNLQTTDSKSASCANSDTSPYLKQGFKHFSKIFSDKEYQKCYKKLFPLLSKHFISSDSFNIISSNTFQ